MNEIGDILWDAFLKIRNDKLNLSLAHEFFRDAFKPERNLKKVDLLNFLTSKFDYHEQVIRQVVEQYFKEEKMSDIALRRKSLILSPKIYQYILDTYGNKSELALMCFEDILFLRVYIDIPSNPDISEILSFTHDSIMSIFDSYIKAKVAFKPKCLNLLQKASSLEIIKPFFENFLPSVFGMKPINQSNNTKKRKRLAEDALVLQWVNNLEHIDSLNRRNNKELSVNFREYFMNFYKRLESETNYLNIYQDNKHKMQRLK